MKYRKKPIVIEARQWDGTESLGREICAWVIKNRVEAEYHPFLADHYRGDPKVYVAHPDPYLLITTLEGPMSARAGDWIIKGVAGEFYPCKPDIFEQTYEPADSPDVSPVPPTAQKIHETKDEKMHRKVTCGCMCHDFGGGPFHPNQHCRCRGGEGFDDLSAPPVAPMPDELQKLVDEQAEDEMLWFVTENITEAYLQQELRRLHAAIENRPALREESK